MNANGIRIALAVAALGSVAYAFTADEVEIFQLHQELQEKYGDKINFYKLLKLPNGQGSTSKEITKNLRKLSRKYHPDKNKKYKTLYSRLNLATQILSNDDTRKTYDYYLKNGFPDYNFKKGGFFFKRVQPQTWFILSFIFLAASFIHYVILKIQYKAQVKRIESFIQQCKEQDTSNGLGETKLTFKQHEEDEGKNLHIKFGSVYLMEDDETESLITADDIPIPSITDTILFKMPKGLWNASLGRILNKTSNDNDNTKTSGTKLGSKGNKKN
ncbi:similar to Saccharomyces cerevisiae YFR041C ERJ5 Type I membrane protein with a J domain is required to preserve the folding capacity of the endoplasmic reticulum [Maudiozyma barnettii]|uniref:Similar to Saccharomyces cerevisiae YFR041C ERJ5 Type I membrane protein with a J domain is required to preserve the folding capacity of the endoplasmic reticulum n=1 Tax=Maudiozyma barnettii TaxID=61262 RepID=A0A8H2VIV0_9SACH|nr:Erj5p [Kazachstania barnettii]CAB4256221.1 similar to Saccharomyces cerevisiae YFR041C ERJ5 Type I membrane protein with a J domain is required to preserve the folding capacity of the endoplasmic reticulum [Kazachstania barnettii]CAD1784830.1 similar to Saccharomyces cerevisiae YFR041C ERJ5 Type I membrane protein with a J domain is required to preserve the folding capacity of the endoplasmic reticulum [Kazachstania barnettii]